MPQLRVRMAQGRQKTQHSQTHQTLTLSLPSCERLLDCFLFCKTDLKTPTMQSDCTELRRNTCKLLTTCEHDNSSYYCCDYQTQNFKNFLFDIFNVYHCKHNTATVTNLKRRTNPPSTQIKLFTFSHIFTIQDIYIFRFSSPKKVKQIIVSFFLS